METETAVLAAQEIPALSVVTATVRSEYAEAIARIVDRIAAQKGADPGIARQIQAKMIHKLIHWILRRGTHFLGTTATLERLDRLAGRLVDLELRRQAAGRPRQGGEPLDDEESRRILASARWPKGAIRIGVLLRAWNQLTYPEQRVLRLHGVNYSVEDIALVLDLSVHAVEFYLNQSRQKLQRIYRSLGSEHPRRRLERG